MIPNSRFDNILKNIVEYYTNRPEESITYELIAYAIYNKKYDELFLYYNMRDEEAPSCVISYPIYNNRPHRVFEYLKERPNIKIQKILLIFCINRGFTVNVLDYCSINPNMILDDYLVEEIINVTDYFFLLIQYYKENPKEILKAKHIKLAITKDINNKIHLTTHYRNILFYIEINKYKPNNPITDFDYQKLREINIALA